MGGYVAADIKERLYNVRTALNMTQEELSLKMGYSHSFFHKLEQPGTTVSESVILALCHRFHVRYDYLVKGQPPMFDEPDARLAAIENAYARLAEPYQICIYEYAKYLADKHEKP